MEKKHLKFRDMFIGVAGIGHFLTCYFRIYLSYFVLTDIIKLPIAYAAIVSTFSQAASTVLNFSNGILIDKTKAGKAGRYRKWFAVLPIVMVFVGWTAFVRFTANDFAQMIISCITVTALTWGQSLMTVVRNVVGAMQAKDASQRASVFGRLTVWGGIGVFLYSRVPVQQTAAGIFGADASYPVACIVYYLLLVILAFVEFKLTEGTDTTAETGMQTAETKNAPSAKKEKNSASFGEMMKTIFTNPQLLVVTLVDIINSTFHTMYPSIAIYYYTYVAEDMALYAVYTTLGGFFVIASGLLLPPIAKALTTRGTGILGSAMAVGGSTVAMLMGVGTPVAYLIGSSVAQFGCQMLTNCINPMFGDCAVYSEYKTGVNSLANVMNVHTIAGFAGSTIRQPVIAAVLAASGYVAGQAADLAVKTGLVRGFMLPPAICEVVALVLLVFCYKLTNARVKEMQQAIDARKAEVQ